MKFDPLLIQAKFTKRYKRFFADAVVESGETIISHCPNTGPMTGLLIEGATAYFTHNPDPKRKLKYTFEMIDVGTSLVGVNTARPNAIVEEAIQQDKIASLTGYDSLKREVKYGQNSRIDILLQSEGKPDCYVEVKNTTLAEDGVAMFPDTVTTRGTKHLNELAEMVQQGHRAVMVYLCNRSDCSSFKVAGHIDKDYGDAFQKAIAAGVEAVCLSVEITPEHITADKELPVHL